MISAIKNVILTMPLEAFLITVVASSTIYAHRKYKPATAAKAPAFLTTLGILGTFLGIAIGLLHFDTNHIQESVPALIKGIKTAFWVSTAGIFGAITIKIRELYGIVYKKSNTEYHGATVNDLAELLSSIKDSLVDKDKATLLGHIRLARQESNDKMLELKNSLDVFCEKVADNNSKALIDALQEVIRDFNTKINDQFGENFKHLNQAVGKTLEWQEAYRLQITEMIEQQTKTANNMSLAVEKYTYLVNEADVFNTTTSSLSKVLITLSDTLSEIETQRKHLEDSLGMLAILVNKASTGLPKIEENIVAIVEQMNKSLNAASTQLGENVISANNEFKKLMLNTMQSTNQEVNANLEKINHEVSSNVSQLIESTKEQVVVLDKALSTELTKSLETFARQLASLSQKFAEDYTPLTEKLREVLTIARSV